MTVDFERTQPADYLTRLAASNLGRAYKSLVVQEMAIDRGHTVIDLGCGPGADLRTFGESAGPWAPSSAWTATRVRWNRHAALSQICGTYGC